MGAIVKPKEKRIPSNDLRRYEVKHDGLQKRNYSSGAIIDGIEMGWAMI